MSRRKEIKTVIQEGVTNSINEDEKTASVTRYFCQKCDVIIPNSIIHESKEYIVKSISHQAFELSKKNQLNLQ